MDSIRISIKLWDNKSLNIVVSSRFTMHLLENNCKFVVSMVNSAGGMSSNDIIVSDANSLLRHKCSVSCYFIPYFGNETAYIFTVYKFTNHNLLCNGILFCN